MMYKMRTLLFKADSIEQLNSKLKYTIGQYSTYNEMVNFCDKIYLKDNYDEIREVLANTYLANVERYLSIFKNVFQETADEVIPSRFETINKCIELVQKIENKNSVKVNGTYYFYQKNADKLEQVNKMVEDYETLLEIEDSPILQNALKEYDESTSSINDPEIVGYFREQLPLCIKRNFRIKKAEFNNMVNKITANDKKQIVNDTVHRIYKMELHRKKQK